MIGSKLALLVSLAVAIAPAHARVWTSAVDSSRTFEADFVQCENDVVTVRLKSGTALSFPLSTVSQADRDFVSRKIGKAPASTPTSGKAKPEEAFNLPKLLKGKLVTVGSDGKAKPFDYEGGRVPDYFLLYVSAYW